MLGALGFEASDPQWIRDVSRSCSLRITRECGCTLATTLPESISSDFDIHFLAADVVLTRRHELLSRLGLNGETEKQRSDLNLIVCAYRKWGEFCAERLEGDYAFALWDNRERRIFCCVDHLGAVPLIYWRDQDRFVAGSNNALVLSVPGVPRRLNRRKLHGLTVPGGQHFRDEETFHEELLSVRSGTCLTIDRYGVRQRTYWEPAIDRSLVPKDPKDAFEALRELLFDAVRPRIASSRKTGVLLSGGLDSSALVAVAARILEKQNRSVVGIAAVISPDNSGRFRDEREFVEEFRGYPNIEIEYSDARGRGPFDHIENPAYFEDHLTRSSSDFLYEAIGELAGARGCDLLLTGGGGEMGVTCWATGYLLELLVRLRLGTLFRELRKAGQLPGNSALRVFARDIIRFFEIGPEYVPPVFFTSEFMAERDTPAWRLSHWPDHQTRQLEIVRHYLRKHALRREEAGSIAMRSPLADKRLLEFCLAAGGELKIRDGYNRHLVRGALDGLLPEKIQWRTSKMPWSPDYAARYDSQLEKAKAFVAAIGRRDPVRSIIDVDRLASALIPAETPGHFWTALARIPITIHVICFLRQFPEFQP